MNGSDHGNGMLHRCGAVITAHVYVGTKQDPFQSAEGALWKRGLEVSLWIKRRYTNTDRFVSFVSVIVQQLTLAKEIRSYNTTVRRYPSSGNGAFNNLLDTY